MKRRPIHEKHSVYHPSDTFRIQRENPESDGLNLDFVVGLVAEIHNRTIGCP